MFHATAVSSMFRMHTMTLSGNVFLCSAVPKYGRCIPELQVRVRSKRHRAVDWNLRAVRMGLLWLHKYVRAQSVCSQLAPALLAYCCSCTRFAIVLICSYRKPRLAMSKCPTVSHSMFNPDMHIAEVECPKNTVGVWPNCECSPGKIGAVNWAGDDWESTCRCT